MICLAFLLFVCASAISQAVDDPSLTVNLFWTTPWENRFKSQHEAVLRSYIAFGHPVKLFYRVRDQSMEMFKAKYAKHNVQFIDLNERTPKLAEQCPYGNWLLDTKYQDGPFYYSHLTDYLRFCILYLEGGIYSDFDALLLRPLEHVAKANPGKLIVGKDDTDDPAHHCTWCLGGGRHYLAPGLMIATSIKNPILKEAMREAFANNNPAVFGWAGPQALTKAVKGNQLAKRNVVILPTHSFYPLNWRQAQHLFRKNSINSAIWTRILNERDTLSLHFYGSTTKNEEIMDGSIIQRFTTVNMILKLKDHLTLHLDSFSDSFTFYDGRSGDNLNVRISNSNTDAHIFSLNGTAWQINMALSRINPSNHFKQGDIISIKAFSGTESKEATVMVIDLYRHVTLVTKTFGRINKVLDLVDSVQRFFPNLQILVGDDGRDATESAMRYKQTDRFTFVPFPYDIGLSAGRNELLKLVTTEYAVFIDDDFVFQQDSDLSVLLYTALAFKIDLAAGKSPEDVSKFQFDYGGVLRVHNETMHLERGFHKELPNSCQTVDFVPNLFLARTEALRQVGWDEALKLGEHEDFFLRAKKSGNMTVATCPQVSFHHRQTKFWENKTEYDRMRLRVYDFQKASLIKHGLQRLFVMGKEVMRVLEISDRPIISVDVSVLTQSNVLLKVKADKPYYRFKVSGDTWKSIDFYESRITLWDLRTLNQTLYMQAGNHTAFSNFKYPIDLSKEFMSNNNLLEPFNKTNSPWKASLGTHLSFVKTAEKYLPRLEADYVAAVYVVKSVPLPEYREDYLFYSSIHQTISTIPNCKGPVKLTLTGWSLPDKIYNAQMEGAVRNYRLQLEVIDLRGVSIKEASDDFDHTLNQWQSRNIVMTCEQRPTHTTVRAVFDVMRGGAYFDKFHLTAECL